MLSEEGTSKLIRKAFKYRKRSLLGKRSSLSTLTYEDEAPMSISRSIVNHVIGQKKAILSQDAGADADLPTSASIADLKIRSIMCVPLITPDGKVLGILQLDTSDRKQFHQDDLDLLVAVAGQASIAIENASMHERILAKERVDRDLQLAEQVQKRFLPKNTPLISGYEFFAHYDPAYEVGGDYYDFVPLPDGRLAVALGDVSGKGVAAALMMAKFSGDTRYCVLTQPTLGEAAARLNKLICEADIDEKFITLCLAILDSSANTVTVCSAGHPPLMIRRSNGKIDFVGEEITGFPLGVDNDATYSEAVVSLEPGDVAVIHSDGVTDARNKAEDLYDSKENPRLRRRLADSPGGPELVGKSILQAIREFSAGHRQADDITLVCLGPKA